MGSFEREVLWAILHLRGEGYAVSIADAIAMRGGHKVSLGSVYGTLDRLQRKGFVRSKFGEATAERGGKRKRHYQITQTGERVLRADRAAVERVWAVPPLGVRA